jgi:hypothetical protein
MEENGTGRPATGNPVVADIRREWHWVRPGLEEILKGDPYVYEIPEDVYAACLNGSATLWITDSFFVITTVFHDRCKKGFLLWYAWSKDRGSKHSSEGMHQFFEDLAVDEGCDFMQSQTSREPLADHFVERLGYSLKTQVLVKTL